MSLWIVAFDQYTLGAQAVDHQMQFRQALLHKEVVLEIVCSYSMVSPRGPLFQIGQLVAGNGQLFPGVQANLVRGCLLRARGVG
jgi:hypothetical protein